MGETPLLCMADKNPDIALAELLLANKANINDKSRLLKETVLHRAAKNGYAAFVEFLLKHGAMPDVRDEYGHTPRECMHAFNNAARHENSLERAIQGLQKMGSTEAKTDFNALDQMLLAAEVEEIKRGKIGKLKRKFGF